MEHLEQWLDTSLPMGLMIKVVFMTTACELASFVKRFIDSEVMSFICNYRTLRGRDQREKCTLNFTKYTLSRPTVLH